jgi:serine protease Do
MTSIRPGETAVAPQRAQRTRRTKAALLGAVALGAAATAGVGDRALLSGTAAAAQTAPTKPAASAQLPSFAEVVDRVKPAVVSVRVKMNDQESQTMPGMGEFNWPDSDLPDDHPFREFFKRFGRPDRHDGGPKFGQPAPRQSMAQGSGFFISADGYLVTNQHVIAKGSDVEVSLDDGRTLAAKVVGTDPYTDLALLKVEGQELPFVELAPQAPRVGDWVLAVGNPFGLGGTVTSGIVSARARDLGAGPSDDFLQIDAPINHGSSGGPAFNLAGQVIGVNTAIASPSGGNVGVAFAIPAETVRAVVAQLKDKGAIERGFLGVQIQPLTKEIATRVGLEKPEGALVSRVEENSPASEGGIQTGDVIRAINGKPMNDARDVSRQIASLPPGTAATLEVWRNKAKQDVSVNLGSLSDEKTASAATSGPVTELPELGLSLAPATGNDQKGVAVVKVEPGSAAAEKGFRVGDMIAEVAGRPVESPADVKRALEANRKAGRKAALFRLQAKDGSRFIGVGIPTA